jgi:DNA-directed RNA polymerase III subunit RPC3
VYDALLARIELKTPSCRTQTEAVLEGEEMEQYSAFIPIQTIASDLDPRLELDGAIAGVGGPPVDGLDDSALSNGVDFDEEDEEDEDDVEASRLRRRIRQVEQHLAFLAQEPYIFATRKIESGITRWGVEFRNLARRLRHLELERLIEARFGTVAVRIVRVLVAKGRLDEKRLQEVGLMASKDLRQKLAQMEAAGFVDLQEVPRDTQRQPSRTIYLWFYDPDRACTMILEDVYKTMSRFFQRLKAERLKLKPLLEKAERTDVKSNMEQYLSAEELKALNAWHEKEALLLGEIGRLDEIVATLRDY